VASADTLHARQHQLRHHIMGVMYRVSYPATWQMLPSTPLQVLQGCFRCKILFISLSLRQQCSLCQSVLLSVQVPFVSLSLCQSGPLSVCPSLPCRSQEWCELSSCQMLPSRPLQVRECFRYTILLIRLSLCQSGFRLSGCPFVNPSSLCQSVHLSVCPSMPCRSQEWCESSSVSWSRGHSTC